ncbi:MAG: hypothetical protein U9R25_18430 [Chloroflexota bacterium]|nr:hypothetical protein [Chloroflexota bacterium]
MGVSRRLAGWALLLALVFLLAGCVGIESPVVTPPSAEAPAKTPSSEPPAVTQELQALPTFTPVPTAVPGTLFVDPSRELGTINPLVFGSNYGPWVSLRPETIPLAEQSGVTLLRYPGGEWGDKNDIQPYQLDQFIALARQLNVEPMINVRLPDSSSQVAADLVRYANIEKGFNIRYWAIGNEPTLYSGMPGWEQWGNIDYYNEQWRQYGEAMVAIDPEILLMGPEPHQYAGTPSIDPVDDFGRNWMTGFLKANGDMVDIVTIHRYPFPSGDPGIPATVDEMRTNSREWDHIIPSLRSVIRETTGRDIPIAVTEINSHYTHAVGGQATPDSFYNAIWWADVLGRLIKNKVDMVGYFILVTRGGQGGYGLLDAYDARPTYYTYQLYKRFGEQQVYANTDDPDVGVYAAKRPDGVLTIMFVNLADETKSMPLWLQNFSLDNDVQVWRLDREHMAEELEPLALENGQAIVLPPQSVTLMVMTPACCAGKPK